MRLTFADGIPSGESNQHINSNETQMKTLNLLGYLAILAIFLVAVAIRADEPAQPADREAVLAKLKANQVSLLSLTI